jgi:hypoxanthine phosphoribosyltransferase
MFEEDGMKILEKPHEIILSETQINKRVKELGSEITRDYSEKDPVFIGILKGSIVFLSDLIRSTDLPISIDFISVSSYGDSMESSGVVRFLYDIKTSIEGMDVLLVEDIVDTGLTLDYLIKNFITRHPKSIKICTLLDKKEARKPEIDLRIEYTGFEVPNKFLVGYGLDYAEKYRNLPFIAAITE